MAPRTRSLAADSPWISESNVVVVTTTTIFGCGCHNERWAHQRHIRDATGRPGRHDRFLPAVLATFAWAFPYQYRPEAAPGTVVQVDFGSGGAWLLTREAGGWVLGEGTVPGPAAALRMPPGMAWRQLTGLPVPAGGYTTEGEDRLVAPLLAVRSIIV